MREVARAHEVGEGGRVEAGRLGRLGVCQVRGAAGRGAEDGLRIVRVGERRHERPRRSWTGSSAKRRGNALGLNGVGAGAALARDADQ